MLQRDTNSEVIQAPKIIALDGIEATIFVGETIRYAEAKTEQGQAGGLSLALTEAQSSPVDTGFQLLIVPHVVPGTNTLLLGPAGRVPPARLLSIGFLEAPLPVEAAQRLPYDILWTTAAANRDDPCKAFPAARPASA